MKKGFRLTFQIVVLSLFTASFFINTSTIQALETINFTFGVTCNSEKGEHLPLEGATVGLYHQVRDPNTIFIPLISGFELHKDYTVKIDNNGDAEMNFIWGPPDDAVNKLADGKYVFLVSYNNQQFGSGQDAFYARSNYQTWTWLYHLADLLVPGVADEVEKYGDGNHEWNLDQCPTGYRLHSVPTSTSTPTPPKQPDQVPADIEGMKTRMKTDLNEEVCPKQSKITLTECLLEVIKCVNSDETLKYLKNDTYFIAKEACRAKLPSLPGTGTSPDLVADLLVDSLGTNGTDGNSKTIFNPGDTVGLHMFIRNWTKKEADVLLGFEVTDPDGNKDYDLSTTIVSFPAKADGVSSKYITPTISKTAKIGTYTFKGKVEYNGKKSSSLAPATFTVVSPGTQPPPGAGTPPALGTPPGAGGTRPGTPTGRTGPVTPKMMLSIHGWAETSLPLAGFEDLDWISVAASVLDSNGKCINAMNNGAVELTFTKDGKNIPVNTTTVLEGNALGEKHAFNRICWSYQAKLPTGVSKAGKYTLNAVYRGNSEYSPISASTTVTFTDKDLTVTKTVIKIAGVQGVSKVALSKLMQSGGNVAGKQAKMEGGQVKIIENPANPDSTITLIPESSVGNGNCDSSNLPVVHLTITKVGSRGGVGVIDDVPAYPNCEPYYLALGDLGDLSEISRIVVTASLPEDPGSSYQSSRDEVVIAVSDSVGAAQPFVKLSSNPSPAYITSSDRVAITATTNRAVADPVFRVSHNGRQSDMSAYSSTGNCSDGIGTCQYSVYISQPEGDYDVSFSSGGTSDSLSFNTAGGDKGVIDSVGLLVGVNEVPLNLYGGMIDLRLDGSPTKEYLVVIHYKNGTEARKRLVFNYDQSDDSNCVYSQDGSCYRGYTKDQSTCTWVNNTCLNPVGCDYRGGPVACPKAGTATPIPTSCDSRNPNFKYNQCIACNTSQAVCQDANGNFTTGPNQSDGGCSSWCSNSNPVPPPDTGPADAGAQGKPCIYWQDNKCYSGTVKAQSTCPSMTTVTNVCASPTGGCSWGDGSKEVNCETGQ